MNFKRDEDFRFGGSVAGFLGGHIASITLKSPSVPDWLCSSQKSGTNGEALRRVLTAALCRLDGHDAMIEPALHGDIAMRPERRRRYDDEDPDEQF